VQVDIPLELDLGPLAWVKDEVVQTLGRARTEVEAIIAGTAAPERSSSSVSRGWQPIPVKLSGT
jgi:hypothetical protein